MNKKIVIGVVVAIIVIVVAIIGVMFLRNDYGMNGNDDYKDNKNNANQNISIQQNNK